MQIKNSWRSAFVVAGAATILTVGCATSESSPDANAAASMPAGAESKMMVIRVKIRVKPDQVEGFRAFVLDEANEARKFDGCERYELFASVDEEHTFMLYEEWASADAFAVYKSSPLLKKSFEVLGPMLAGPPDSAYYDAQVAN